MSKQKQVKILINIGTIDAKRLGLGVEELFMEGDVINVDEKVADQLVRERLAKEYDATARKEDEERAEKAHEAAIQAAMPAAEREVALEEAKKEAAKRLKSGAREAKEVKTVEATPSTIGQNPHSPVKKES